MENYFDPDTREWVTSESRYRAVADWPPYDALDELVYGPPGPAWALMLDLLAAVPEDTVSYVGAGALETLVRLRPADIVPWLEAAVEGNERLRIAADSMWVSRGSLPPEWELRLEQLLGPTFEFLPGESDQRS